MNPIKRTAKKIVSALPPTLPSKVYGVAVKVPGLKAPLSSLIQRLAPTHVDMPEGRLEFDKSDPAAAGSIGMGRYEEEAVKLFRSFLSPGMNVVDIGANIGYYTVIAAGRIGSNGRVFAFEPDPRNFALLSKNISTNSFTNVTTFPMALADKAGERELFFSDNQCTLSFSDKKGTGHSEQVHTETLDSILAKAGSPHIDVIKMDIEGAEPIAFAGMQETLRNSPNLTMLFEFYPNAIKRLGYVPEKFLKDIVGLGYTLSAIEEDSGAEIPVTDTDTYALGFGEKDRTQNLIARKVR